MGAALPSLLGKNELRNQTPIGQAALKVVLAQGEVVVFYDRLPSSLSEASCGDIDLLEYGQAASFKSGPHFRGVERKLVPASLAHGNGKIGSSPDPRAISLQESARPV